MALNGVVLWNTSALNLFTRYSFSLGIFASVGRYGNVSGRVGRFCIMSTESPLDMETFQLGVGICNN